MCCIPLTKQKFSGWELSSIHSMEVDGKMLGTVGLPKSKGQTRHQVVTKAHTEAQRFTVQFLWSIGVRVDS